MTLNEAIEYYQKAADKERSNAYTYVHIAESKRILKHSTEARYCELSAQECEQRQQEYHQIAEWLKELKAYRDHESICKIDCSKTKCNSCMNHNACDYEY